MTPNQKLYAMRDTATDYVKIGISKHPLIRSFQLSEMVGNEVKLFLEKDAAKATVAEKFVHRELRELNIKGEWFALSTDDLLELPELFEAACQLEKLPPLLGASSCVLMQRGLTLLQVMLSRSCKPPSFSWRYHDPTGTRMK